MAVHAVIFAAASFTIPGLSTDGPDRHAIAPVEDMQVVALRAVQERPAELPRTVQPEAQSGGGDGTGAAAGPPSPADAAPASQAPARQFAQASVSDSWSAFKAVAPRIVNSSDYAAEEEEQVLHVAVYSRGSVAQAKAQWAANAGGDGSQGGRGLGVSFGTRPGGTCNAPSGLPGILR